MDGRVYINRQVHGISRSTMWPLPSVDQFCVTWTGAQKHHGMVLITPRATCAVTTRTPHSAWNRAGPSSIY